MFKYLITIIILKLLDENLMERTKAGKIVIDIKNQDYLELPISVLDERFFMASSNYVVYKYKSNFSIIFSSVIFIWRAIS